jgi:sec-independent protein translocase protein TatC
MRRILKSATWIILLPFRLFVQGLRGIPAGIQSIVLFFTEVPEDVALTETIGETFESRESLLESLAGLGEHIDALRRHLLRSVIALGITTAFSFLFATDLMRLLAAPLGSLDLLQVIEPTESIGVFMRVSLLSGVALAMPWFVMEMFIFVAPGLMPRSRIMLAAAIPVASLLFVLGMLFTYFVMLPAAIPFLYEFMDFRAAWRPSAYFGLVTSLMFWIGIAFQMPLVVYSLAAVGLLHASQLARHWRVAIVVIAIIAAAVTPTVDPVNMFLVMVPMLLLYGFSILGAAVAGAGRRRDLRRRAIDAQTRA